LFSSHYPFMNGIHNKFPPLTETHISLGRKKFRDTHFNWLEDFETQEIIIFMWRFYLAPNP